MLFAQAIFQFDATISEINAQIEALRLKLSQVEHERQNLLATEQMWESAIAQLSAAKAATEAIGQHELIAHGRAAVDAMFNELPQLPATSEAEPSEAKSEPLASSPEPESATSEPPAIDVKATTELDDFTEPAASTEATKTAPEPTQQAVKRYTQIVKQRFAKVFKMKNPKPSDLSPASVKSTIINRTDISFMGAVNLERTGKDFWKAVDAALDKIEESRKAASF